MNYLKQLAKAFISEKYRPAARRIYESLRYFGNQVVCPCCGRHFRKFLPYPKSNRCPWCRSSERHRLAWLYLKNKTNLFSDNLRVLHFAPEYCLQKNLRSMSNLDYIGADLDSPLAMVRVDIMNIAYEDNSFDAVFCSHVLEHVMDDRKAMRELFRVLKFDGWAIIQVPVDLSRDETFEDRHIVSPEDRERIYGRHNHVRVYGRDYKDRLEKAGFTVKVDGYVRELGDDMVQRYGLDPAEDIYFCTKPKSQKD